MIKKFVWQIRNDEKWMINMSMSRWIVVAVDVRAGRKIWN